MPESEQLVDSKPRFKRVSRILTEFFPGDSIKIVDESHRHAKHVGRIEKKGTAEGAEETHFAIEIASEKFKDLSRIDRQRMIHDLLKEEFETGLHSLKLSLKEI
ncbi:BolA family transcriptional regulator [Acetobacteraceae bacterium]|nr:BolA family transcriptional regulator [Acetobacteraceae bacterium]